jgi:hypothetical protein
MVDRATVGETFVARPCPVALAIKLRSHSDEAFGGARLSEHHLASGRIGVADRQLRGTRASWRD